MAAGALTIRYLTGPRLRRALLAAADWVDGARDELNRINVFPVPDGDTGTNFAATLRAAAEGVRDLHRASLPEVTRAMTEASLFGAHGNSGMLLSQFLVGLRRGLGQRDTAGPVDVARAIREGADQLRRSLDEPVEGTILTISRETAEAAEHAARGTADLGELMRHVLSRGRAALRRTPELLAVLREAGVVDAGAQAFVRTIEGIVRLIEGDPVTTTPVGAPTAVPHAAAEARVAAERDYRYCIEVLVRGGRWPSGTELRARLRELGGSIVVASSEELLKIHIHTDDPDRLAGLVRTWGTIEATKADDMRAQHEALHVRRRPLAIVVDSSCDLPDDIVDRYGVHVVPLQVMQGGRTLKDRVDIAGEELYERMREGNGEPFTTSQPTPGAFAAAFRDARAEAREVLGIFLAGSLSGTLASARAAAEASGLEGITIVDSCTASFGLGLLALRAAELAEDGMPVDAIARELARIRDQSGALFTVATFEHLLRSGRVGRGRAWLGTLLDIKPILEIGRDGRVGPVDRVRGAEAVLPRMLTHLDRRLRPQPAGLRMAVAHADVADLAERVRAELVARYAPRDCFVGHVTAALGVHTGPGAWGVFYQVED